MSNKAFGGITGGGMSRMPEDIYEAIAGAVHSANRARAALTVTDVERLAKAGVAINISDVINHLVPDSAPVPMMETEPFGDDLTSALLERYKRNKRARDRGFEGFMAPFRFLATEHGDSIHVYVAPTDGRDPVVLKDDKAIFPSDQLMSSIYLMEKVK
jgi:hypothetical protein